MRVSLGISTACLAAASIAASEAGAQTPAPTPPPPRARSVQALVIQKGGGYLGVGGVEVTPEKVKALSLKEEGGVLVSSVTEDGPAAKAGVKEGDVVLEFNGAPVQGTVQFQRMVAETPPGRQVKLTIWRNGASQTIAATIGERKSNIATLMPDQARSWTFEMPDQPFPRMPEMPKFEAISPNPALGIYGEPLGENDQLAEFFGVADGVLVRSVRKGSPADKAGIKAGDVITKVDDSHVAASGDITKTLRALRGKKSSCVVTVVRNKKEMPITVTLEQSPVGGIRPAQEVVNC